MRLLTAFLFFTYTVFAVQPNYQEYLLPVGLQSLNDKYNEPIKVLDYDAARTLGLLAFHCPTTNTATCDNCHTVSKGGFSDEPFPVGKKGMFDRLMLKYDSTLVIDVQPVATPPFINGIYDRTGLTDGSLGSAGMNSQTSIDSLIKFNGNNAKGWDGYYTQVFAAFDAHSQAGLPEMLRRMPFFNDLAFKAFGHRYVNETSVSVSIGIFEKSFIPHDAPFQQYLKGEISRDKLRSPEGMDLVLTECVSCHQGEALGLTTRAKKIPESDFEGYIRASGEEADRDMVKVPSLYNLPDRSGNFHTDDKGTIYKAIKAHGTGLTAKEMRDMARFLKYDLHDPQMGERTVSDILDNYDVEE